MIYENKCDDRKATSRHARMESFKEIVTLNDQSGHEASLENYMIRSTKVRWLTYKEDMEFWELWDEREEIMDRHSRSRAREVDKNSALAHGGNYRYRSRSSGRSRRKDNANDILRDRSCNAHGEHEDDRNKKEQVKFAIRFIGTCSGLSIHPLTINAANDEQLACINQVISDSNSTTCSNLHKSAIKVGT